MIPFTNLKAQYDHAKKDIDCAIKYCIDNSHYIIGPVVDEFERKIADHVGAEDCAATGSGSTALLCALHALNIGKGDEVITTPHSFVSTSESIIQTGATPVFVDIDSNYLINIEQIPSAITPNTKAILFVDIYGQCPNINKLKKIAKQYNLFLIEDAAQSFSAKYHNNMVGSLVDLTCFSFNPVKTLGAMGDAGAVTGSTELINKVKLFRDHGRDDKWSSKVMGYNARIDSLQARIVQAKLPYLVHWVNYKRKIADRYTKELNYSFITPTICSYGTHVWYVYVIRVATNIDRNHFIEYMKNNNIMCNIHYKEPITKQPAYLQYAVNTQLPMSDYVCEKIVSLPCYFGLTDEQQSHIINTANKYNY